MGISGQGEKSLSPKTQKNDNDNAIRKIINKPVTEGWCFIIIFLRQVFSRLFSFGMFGP